MNFIYLEIHPMLCPKKPNESGRTVPRKPSKPEKARKKEKKDKSIKIFLINKNNFYFFIN